MRHNGANVRGEWPALKAKLAESNPLANLPYLIDGKTVISQSNACLIYLADRFGLLGSRTEDASMKVEVEQCLCQCMDLRDDFVSICYQNARPYSLFYAADAKHEPVWSCTADEGEPGGDVVRYLSVTAPMHFAKWEAWFAAKNTPYLLGDTPSAPDFPLCESSCRGL